MSIDPSTIIASFEAGTIAYVKISLLILIGLYTLFSFMLAIKIRSLNKIVFLPRESGEGLIRLFAIIYLLVALSLFIATLVIV